MGKTCIVISGIDGSGKTTVIEALRAELASRGLRTAYVWLRFNHYMVKPLHALARPLGLADLVTSEMGTAWQHRFHRSPLFCRVYVAATYVDTLISRLKYQWAARGADVVICDRWVTDIIADLATKTHDRGFVSGPWARRLLRLLPSGARLVVVHRPTDAVRACRVENRIDPDFDLRLAVYADIMAQPWAATADNSGTVAECVRQITSQCLAP